MQLVGRVHERAEIAAALSGAASAREGGVIAFEGEAGIGKSRLLSHLTAAAEGCIVLPRRARRSSRPTCRTRCSRRRWTGT